MTYGHLRAYCLYTGIISGPNARYRVWESLYLLSLWCHTHTTGCAGNNTLDDFMVQLINIVEIFREQLDADILEEVVYSKY